MVSEENLSMGLFFLPDIQFNPEMLKLSDLFFSQYRECRLRMWQSVCLQRTELRIKVFL
ncbi:hypothetical protein SAMN04488136_108105 [Vibrio xiamenensis]|uniref:Uncharacterized protein n=1 Tax=Vibrio xiamenensis TaxID=861298 RepID=A0A1G7ZQH5_9VIBR|nr:hypothetical protein SAMN04488136_108105 [Vibrio xiamenensis]